MLHAGYQVLNIQTELYYQEASPAGDLNTGKNLALDKARADRDAELQGSNTAQDSADT